MKILAFDSTARTASVAVLEDERLIGAYSIDNGLTQSELLLPMAENLLSSLKLSFSDIEILSVSVGPGSFTGVRIGVALVKGIAFGKDIPCIPVSTLEALAENLAPINAILVPTMDARRGQLYTAVFDSDGEAYTRLTPDMAISVEELAQKLSAYKNRKIYLCGDGYGVAKAGLEKLGITVESTPPLLISQNAFSIGKLAARKHKSSEATNDKDISPTYLRLPQAERERLEKQKLL